MISFLFILFSRSCPSFLFVLLLKFKVLPYELIPWYLFCLYLCSVFYAIGFCSLESAVFFTPCFYFFFESLFCSLVLIIHLSVYLFAFLHSCTQFVINLLLSCQLPHSSFKPLSFCHSLLGSSGFSSPVLFHALLFSAFNSKSPDYFVIHH